MQNVVAVTAIRLALRRLLRAPAYAATVVASVAIGLGLTGALFALVHGVLLRPLPYPDAERLAVVRHQATRGDLPMTGLSPGLVGYYAGRSTTIERLGVYSDRPATFTDGAAPERTTVALVTPDLMAILRPRTVAGRGIVASDYVWGGEHRVLISYALWRERYGADPSLVGRTIEIDRNPHRVVGVADPAFRFPDARTQAWVAFGWPDQVASRASLRALAFDNVVRLRPGATAEAAARELGGLVSRIPDAFPDVTRERLGQMGLRVRVLPMRDAVVGDVRLPLLLVLASSGLLLVLTWANAANITLVRAERLRREVAVMRALGARDAGLAARFFAEAAVLAAVGGGGGLLLAAVLIRARFGFAPDGLPRLDAVALDAPTVALTLALAAASALLLGATGYLATRRTHVAPALSGGSARVSAGRREHAVRQGLVAGQVALALTLLIGSGLMARSFWQLKQARLGFVAAGVLTFRLPIPPGEYSNYHASARVHDSVLRALRAVPGVAAAEAASATAFPLHPAPAGTQLQLRASDRAVEGEDAPWGRLGFATPGYFKAIGVPMVKGRSFEWRDTGREGHGIILSASLARALFGEEDPVGRRVRWARSATGPDFVVVGVVGDVPGERIADGPARTFYFANVSPPRADTVTGTVHDYIPFDEVYVLRTASPPAAMLPVIRRIVREVDPKLVVTRVAPLSQVVAESMARTRLAMLLLLAGAAAAAVLGMIGIYGTLSYAVTLRRTELGIRMAVGATPARVVLTVVREGALQAGAGIVAGLLLALALSRYLRALLYGVTPTDPLAFGVTATLLFLVALAASYIPARRAGRIDPVRAIREQP